jgi:hypothetical protein
MQENEFEKRVRLQMEEFTLVPNGEVWRQVEPRIKKEKGKRRLFFWLFAGLLIIGITGGIYFFSVRNQPFSTYRSPGKNSGIEKSIIDPSKKVDVSTAKRNTSIQISKSKNERSAFPAQDIRNDIRSNRSRTASLTTTELSKPLVKVKKETVYPINNRSEIWNDKKGGNNSVKLPVTERRLEGKTALPPHKYLLSQIAEKSNGDTVAKVTAPVDNKPVTGDTLMVLKKNDDIKPGKQKDLKKRAWGFTLFGGLSDNISGLGIGSEKSLFFSDRQNSGSQSTTPSSVTAGTLAASGLQHKSAASFGGGVYHIKALTKKLAVSAGVAYHFMSTNSVIGDKIDSTIHSYDSVLQISPNARPFYLAGQTTSYNNKYHIIQLPINLQLQVNNSIDHPLHVSLGLSPSLLIASKALYLNRGANAYYREQNQFSHFLLFGQSELQYTISSKVNYQFSVGPTLTYNLNSFSKTAISTSQHLLFTGIKANIVFK